jgi:hypothetical protein
MAESRRMIALIMAVLLSSFPSNCSNLRLQSQWRDRDIIIDGNYDEWEGTLLFSEDKGATLGFINDEDNLYLCLMSADQSVLMRAISSGFIVWFDGSGKKNEKTGLRFPVGGKIFSSVEPDRKPGFDSQDRIKELLEQQFDLFIITGEKPQLIKLAELNKLGIALRLGQHLGRLVYELQIPLSKSDTHPYAVNAVSDRPVKIKFELGEMERPERPGGEMRPMGVGFPGEMEPGKPEEGGKGFSGGGRHFERPAEFDFMVSVELAKRPAAEK